jgi:hypothetical protein
MLLSHARLDATCSVSRGDGGTRTDGTFSDVSERRQNAPVLFAAQDRSPTCPFINLNILYIISIVPRDCRNLFALFSQSTLFVFNTFWPLLAKQGAGVGTTQPTQILVTTLWSSVEARSWAAVALHCGGFTSGASSASGMRTKRRRCMRGCGTCNSGASMVCCP